MTFFHILSHLNPPFHKFDTGNPYAASVSRPSIVFLFFEENLLLLKCKFSHETKYLYYTFYLFYCQSRISFLCNLSRNICEILRFFRRKFQKSVLFFSFITKSPGKWGFLLKNVCKKLENGEQKGAPYKRNAFVLTRNSIHIFQHLSNTFSDIFWHLGMCKMLCICLSMRSYFIHDTFKKLSFVHHAKFIFPFYTSKCIGDVTEHFQIYAIYAIFSVFHFNTI